MSWLSELIRKITNSPKQPLPASPAPAAPKPPGGQQHLQFRSVAAERLAVRSALEVNEWNILLTTDRHGAALIRVRDGAATLNLGVKELRALHAVATEILNTPPPAPPPAPAPPADPSSSPPSPDGPTS
jgi:hypothetical protein